MAREFEIKVGLLPVTADISGHEDRRIPLHSLICGFSVLGCSPKLRNLAIGTSLLSRVAVRINVILSCGFSRGMDGESTWA